MSKPESLQSPMGIGALSKRTGCNIETIRYYEKCGLLPNPPRTEGGHRLYSSEHLKRLTFIKRSRSLGFTMAEIKQLFRLADHEELTCEAVHSLTLEHVADIQQKIADLKRLEIVLLDIAGKCSDGVVPECPVIDALYEPLSRKLAVSPGVD